MDKSKLQAFLTEAGHLDLLREFERTLARQRARPLTPDSDPGSSDSPDHLVSPRSGAVEPLKGLNPKRQASRRPLMATPSGKSTSLIYASPVSWRTPSQPAAAPQGAVDDGGVKAAPRPRKTTEVTRLTSPPPPPHRGPKPPPMFVQDKDRWTELRRRCAEKGIQSSQARNSVQGLKLQAKTVADFKNLQNLLVCYKFKFHTYFKESGNRVVLRGVPKEIPVDEVKKTCCPKPSGSVGTPNTEPIPQALDLVLVSGTAEANDKATKAAFFKIRSVCPLRRQSGAAPQTRLTRQCHNCQSYGHSSRYCYHLCALREMPG
ncbi:Nucleic-acid-binding protein from transposon X-element [Eumeta japonica]|uniref:Nucleic-acid-binding protein from transposon X-element n=1 Tax=Eumeta variegata TaxID=151549 RepID=A0A4C1XUP8_EUMVA|nr:Nucleic-acid-binding protein from transposon X-element [Eumeta japonica]